MPALAPVPNVLSVAWQQSNSIDTDVVNKSYFKYTGAAPTPAQADAIAAGARGQWVAQLANAYNVDFILENVHVEDLTSPLGAVGDSPGADHGTRAGSALPADVCAVVSCHIGRRYRGGHPRKYLAAGVLADTATINTWAGAFVTALEADYAAYAALTASSIVTILGGTSEEVNVSYYEGSDNVLYPSGRYHAIPRRRLVPVVDPILTYTVNPKLASQRRRNLQSS